MNEFLRQPTEDTDINWGETMRDLYQHELIHNTEEWNSTHTEEPDTTYEQDIIDSEWGKEMARLYESELKN